MQKVLLLIAIAIFVFTSTTVAQNAWQDGGVTLWTTPNISHEHIAASIGEDRFMYVFQPPGLEHQTVVARIMNGGGEFLLEDSLVISNPEVDSWGVSLDRASNGDGVLLFIEQSENRNLTYRIQRITPDGELVWENNGIQIRAIVRWNRLYEVIADEDNGFFVVLPLAVANNRLVFKFDADGELCEGWEEEGVDVRVGDWGRLLSDGSGGLWFYNSERFDDIESYNHLLPDGSLQWDEMQVYVHPNGGIEAFPFAITPAPDGGLYVAFQDRFTNRIGLVLMNSEGETVVTGQLGENIRVSWYDEDEPQPFRAIGTDDSGRLYIILSERGRAAVLFDPTQEDPLPWGEDGVRLSIEAHLNYTPYLNVISGESGVFFSSYHPTGEMPGSGLWSIASYIGGIDFEQNEWGEEIYDGLFEVGNPTAYQATDRSVWVTTSNLGAINAFHYSVAGENLCRTVMFPPLDPIRSRDSHITPNGNYKATWSQKHRGFCVQELNRNGEQLFEEAGLPIQQNDSQTWLQTNSRMVRDHLFVVSEHYEVNAYGSLSIFDGENNQIFETEFNRELIRGWWTDRMFLNSQQDAVVFTSQDDVLTAIDLEGNVLWQTECQSPFEQGIFAGPIHFPELSWIVVHYNGEQAALFNVDDRGDFVWEEPIVLDLSGSVLDIAYRDDTITVIAGSRTGHGDNVIASFEKVDVNNWEPSEPIELFPFLERSTESKWEAQTASNGNIWFKTDRYREYSHIAGINSNGERITGDFGIRLSDVEDTYPIMTVDPNGGCWVVWKSNGIRAVHFDANGGMFRGRWSRDGELVFEDPNLELVEADLDSETNTLYVTAKNDSRYFVQLIGEEWLSVRETAETIPNEIVLHPPVPNPFNSTTTISYALPTAGLTTVQIFDIKGRLVETLADGYCQTGVHSKVLNASEMASGLYFVKLSMFGRTITEKMALVR